MLFFAARKEINGLSSELQQSEAHLVHSSFIMFHIMLDAKTLVFVLVCLFLFLYKIVCLSMRQ